MTKAQEEKLFKLRILRHLFGQIRYRRFTGVVYIATYSEVRSTAERYDVHMNKVRRLQECNSGYCYTLPTVIGVK